DIELDIEKKCPALKQYITGSEKSKLEEEEWIIDLDFDTVKSMFDPVIAKILRLIGDQLSKCSDCSVLFLVGGFGESKYLQHRIKERFENQVMVAIPPNPSAAIVTGACEYGLDMKIVTTRVLKWTYGVQVSPLWKTGDPLSRKGSDGRIDKFLLLARKGTEVDVNEEFSDSMVPIYPDQTSILFQFFYTTNYSATYCDEPGMKKLGSFEVTGLPTERSGLDRS
ncbi:36748_t:CDS:2, partial [Racocetra persica]